MMRQCHQVMLPNLDSSLEATLLLFPLVDSTSAKGVLAAATLKCGEMVQVRCLGVSVVRWLSGSGRVSWCLSGEMVVRFRSGVLASCLVYLRSRRVLSKGC
uniref:Uncharacterized protein n=1 Tax=Salix viminalis TaxID=40686 RepID=A0A6N2KUE7_SALVM